MRHARTLRLLAVLWTVVTLFLFLVTAEHRTTTTDDNTVDMVHTKKGATSSPRRKADSLVATEQNYATAIIGPTLTSTPSSPDISPSTTDRTIAINTSDVTTEDSMSQAGVIQPVHMSKVGETTAASDVLSIKPTPHSSQTQTTHLNLSLFNTNMSQPIATSSEQNPASIQFKETMTTSTTKTTNPSTTFTPNASHLTTTPTTSNTETATTTTTKPTTTTQNNSTLSLLPASRVFFPTTNTPSPITSLKVDTRTPPLNGTTLQTTHPTLPDTTTQLPVKQTTSIRQAIHNKTINETTTLSKNDTVALKKYKFEKVKTKTKKLDVKLLPFNSTIDSTDSVEYRNAHTNNSQSEMDSFENVTSGHFNISLPDDGEIVFSDTGMWTTPGKLSATKVIRLGYLTGSQVRETNETSEFYHTGFYRRPGQVISGALTLAVVEINNDPHILPEHRMEFLPQETYGEETESILRTTLLLDKNVSAYIGPQETCMHEARLAAVFNIPMISYYCSDYTVSDKTKYPTFVRTKPTESQISRSVASLLMTHNWTKVTFVYSNENEFQHTAETIIALLKSNNISVTQQERYKGPYFHNHEENPFARIVSRTFVDTRIYLMLGQSYDFVGLMANLYERGLLDTGEYFVVGVYLNYYDFTMPSKYLAGTFESDSLERIALAFKYYIGVIHTAPVYPEYKVFTHKVNKYLERPPFNHKNPYKVINIGKIVRLEAAYLYDAVKLYAQAAHSAWMDGKSVKDGREIFKRIRGRTFKSVSGFYFRINSNGDAEGNFSLIARRFTKGKGWGLYPVGVFRLSENLTGYPTFHLFKGENISWPDGKGPPLDEPPCGYRGEKCIPEKTYIKEIIAGVVGGIAVIVIVILVIIYRNWKYEQDLSSLLWKIDYREITFREPLENTPTPLFSRPWLKSLSAGANLLGKRDDSPISQVNGAFRSSQVSLGSHLDVNGGRHLYTRVGTYKAQIVAVRKVNKRQVELTRTMRKELKIMRELRHQNINSFIGASVDGPYVLIVSEYCSKGSLQDILENDEMQLDQMFTDSLVHDIILGMIYLHDSEVKSHGKLKSSNCVVDSRWVLKITDFGLHEFMSEAKDDIGEYAHYRNLLWRAPELLRDKSSPRGTQPGDVYSFAVILFEIYSRKGPYGDTEFMPKEIVERVRRCHNGIPFRPRLAALETTDRYMTDIIKECWDEDPSKRPDFKSIRQKLKPLLKGMKSNIFDNMMGMMEKYASNLEAVIQDRTGQLIEEKKKTEELLLRMLPRSVAEQLKRGKKVEAELFDSVTIYLSDICGFTAMSSESSPMQVVDLLNDLYTLFDSIIGNYDVYKVETIGDAYMVVSGLPKKNGILHAGEIASMSLHLLVAIKKFRIHHRPNDTLKLRIGLHSGSCVSGVVGQKMPRYCLFGDTVNTASRMESTGMPLRIHCSHQCKELLDKLGGYEVEERGIVHLKGKGNVTTYWIVGENKSRRQERIANMTTTLCPHSSNSTPCDELFSIADTPGYINNAVANAVDAGHTNAICNIVEERKITTQNSPSLQYYMKAQWTGDDPSVDSYYLRQERNRRRELFQLAHRNLVIGSASGSYETDENNPENSPLLKKTFMDVDTDDNLQVTPV